MATLFAPPVNFNEISSMRKRLRKKKHVGEFQEFIMDLSIVLTRGTDLDSFFDEFITDAVEANDLQFGGVGMGLQVNGALQIGRRCEYQANRDRVLTWLSTNQSVRHYEAGDPVDGWYAP